MTRTMTPHDSSRGVWVLAFMLLATSLLATAPMAQAQLPDGSSPEDAAAMEARYATQSLRVSLWLNKSRDEIYRRGEPLNVTFQTNADAYAVLYHIDVEGRVSVLWPTSRYSDGFAFGGHEYRLPARQGARLRVGDQQGQGFVQAVVSAYPFDLRDLELDFYHEPTPEPYDFYVAGDPYLAMNEVNFVVTGLEDPSEYAISNHVGYYVHREVDHPRYLCFQCHDSGESYDPYRDSCTINVEYDYSWHNDWWDRYGYYPVYYYPVYAYVDPWAGIYWTNYWYRPWYRWPWSPWHSWSYSCYSWHYSPYWRHDVYVARKHDERRYRPLDRDQVRQRDGSVTRTKNELVRGERPADERIRAMKDRTVIAGADRDRTTTAARDRIRGGGATLKPSTDRTAREQQRFEPQRTQRTSPGLRVGEDRTVRVGRSADRVTPGTTPRVRADQRPSSRVSPQTRRDDSPRLTPRTTTPRNDDRRTIRPAQPSNDRDRVWSNRRSSGSSSNRPKSPPSTRSSKPTTPRKETVKPPSSSPRSSGGSSRSAVRPSSPPKRPSSPPPSSPRSSGGGGSRSKSSRSKSGGRG